jgi:hypothetical protein
MADMMKFDPSKELSERELKDLLACDRTVNLIKHAKDRMQERNYSLRDIMHIIAHGTLIKSEFFSGSASWRYVFKGEDLEGDTGGVVLSVNNQYRFVIITVLA